MADGPDIFGIDKPAPTDPWAQVRAQQSRLGRTPDLAPAAPAPLPGVFVDSAGRAWADVSDVDTAGTVKKTRKQLTPEEIDRRRALAAKVGADTQGRKESEQTTARDALASRRQGVSPSDAAAGMAMGGRAQSMSAFDLAGQMVRGPSGPNPMRPIVESGAREALGGPEIDPATGKPIPGTFEPGYLERQKAAAQQAGDAEVAKQRAMTELLAQQGLRNELEIAAQADRERLAAERMDQQVRALADADQRVGRAANELRRQPGVNPERFWNSRTNGQKAAFIIAGMFRGGLIGRAFGPFQHLEQAVKSDIEAQESDFDRAKTVFDAATNQAVTARNTLNGFIEATGDRRAGESMMEETRWRAMKADFEAKAHEFGVPITEANVAQAMAEFDQKIAEARTRWETIIASTPRTVGGGLRSPLTPLQQKMLGEEHKAGLAAQQKFGEQAISEAGQTQRAQIEASGKTSDTTAQQKFDQRKWVTEQTESPRRELQRIRDFKEKYGGRSGDVPGKTDFAPLAWVGLNEHQMTAEARAAKDELTRIVFIRLRRESGAATPDTEVMREAKNTVDAMTETDIHTSLEAREREAQEMIDYFERAPDESSVEQVLRGPQPSKQAITSGNVPDPTVVDQ